MCRFNSFSPGQKAIHVGITRGFMKAPGFRPSHENQTRQMTGLVRRTYLRMLAGVRREGAASVRPCPQARIFYLFTVRDNGLDFVHKCAKVFFNVRTNSYMADSLFYDMYRRT